MPMLTDLAAACRKSGLKVEEVDGWRTRGHGGMGDVRTIVCHHTAGPASGNYPSLGVVTHGREGLPGPLSQLGLGRDGTVYVIAAGLAYHAGDVLQSDYGNYYSIGIEAEATGVTSWPAVQMDAYARLCAALCEHYGVPVSRVLGHKEVCAPRGRKIDPNFDMAALRQSVADTIEGDDMAQYEDQLAEIARKQDQTLKEVRAFRAGKAKNDAKVRQALARLEREVKDDATKSQVREVLSLLDADE